MDDPVVLQSGFVIVPNDNYVIDPPTEEEQYTMRDLKYNNHIVRMQSSFAYHGGINKLFKEYLNNGLILHDFNVMEGLYSTIIDAFNNFSFKEFILLQTNNTTLDHYGKRFIKDVYAIMNKEQPKLSLEVWAEMVTAKPDQNGLHMDEKLDTNTPVIQVEDFIMKLLENHNGPETLMMVAGIIFGNKRAPILD